MNASGSSLNLRVCGSCPSFAPPGRDFSRFAFLSVDGGFDDVRDVFSGVCRRKIRSINSSLLKRCKSLRSIALLIQRISTLEVRSQSEGRRTGVIREPKKFRLKIGVGSYVARDQIVLAHLYAFEKLVS